MGSLLQRIIRRRQCGEKKKLRFMREAGRAQAGTPTSQAIASFADGSKYEPHIDRLISGLCRMLYTDCVAARERSIAPPERACARDRRESSPDK
jgi:hypothetical protein